MLSRRRSSDSPGNPRDLVVVGLGNPGEKYSNTRHNVGADAVSLLASRHGERLRIDSRSNAAIAEARIGGKRVILAVSTTWMNESGIAVASLLRRYDLDDVSKLVLVHDELDLPPGRIKVKLGGGLAGNNGLRSVSSHLGTQDFTRVRIGIGKPPGGAAKGADWVLAKIPKAHREEADLACELAADAVELIADDGLDSAMQRVNAKQGDD